MPWIGNDLDPYAAVKLLRRLEQADGSSAFLLRVMHLDDWSLWVSAYDYKRDSMRAVDAAKNYEVPPDWVRKVWDYALVAGYPAPVWATLNTDKEIVQFLVD